MRGENVLGLQLIRGFLLVGFLIIKLNANATICATLASGDWNNASTWSCGAKPGCGDTVQILAGHTVSITTQQDYSMCGSPVIITIYGSLKFVNGNKLRLSCNSTLYLMAGGSLIPGSGGGNTNYIELCNAIVWNAASGTTYGPNCFGCPVLLPIGATSFAAKAMESSIELSWQTETETNNDYFEIERSENGLDFNSILIEKTKAVNGNSQSKINYSSTDNDPEGNLVYYRLKEVHQDKSIAYSKTVTASFSKKFKAPSLVPNPNNGVFSILLPGNDKDSELKLIIKSFSGELIYWEDIQTEGKTSIKITHPSRHICIGFYICTILWNGTQYQFKFQVI